MMSFITDFKEKLDAAKAIDEHGSKARLLGNFLRDEADRIMDLFETVDGSGMCLSIYPCEEEHHPEDGTDSIKHHRTCPLATFFVKE